MDPLTVIGAAALGTFIGGVIALGLILLIHRLLP